VTRRKHSSGRSNISRRQKGVGSTLTLKELVEEYLAQHDAEPETIDKLGWLLAKALRPFGDRRLPELRSQEIAAWRMTISPGHRFEATQVLRQVLARAVVWGMIDSNPAKQGVDNPQRRRTEKRPFESWAQLDELAVRLGPRYGPPVLFAAATGLRPGVRSQSPNTRLMAVSVGKTHSQIMSASW
jgi:integrase